MKHPGIYRLQFPTGHYYIGSSQDYNTRCRYHQNSMARGKHDSPRVQNVYNKYQTLPIFGLVVSCGLSELELQEQELLDVHVGNPMCLNISRCAEAARRGVKGAQHSEEHKQYMREKMRGRVFSEEHRKRISAAKKGKSIGDSQTPEANAKRSAAMKGRSVPHEKRAAISKTLMGHKPAFSKPVILLNTGRIFESVMQAERVTGAVAIGRACRRGYSAGKMLDGKPMRWGFVP